MQPSSLCLIALVALLACLPPSCSLQLPHVLSSGMVLQRDAADSGIWGAAAAGSEVSVTLDSQPALRTFADPLTGQWQVRLPPQPADLLDHRLVVGGDGQQLVLERVHFGDVLLCSGQSNMGVPVAFAFNSSAEIADSAHYPQLHTLQVPLLTANSSLNDTGPAVWRASSPQSIAGFSAVCYFTGRALYQALGGQVPVGLIESDVGGTRIETWTSLNASQRCGPVESQSWPENPGLLFNGMIAPLTPLRLRAALWYAHTPLASVPQSASAPLTGAPRSSAVRYQGENNIYNASGYACRFPVMIADWRSSFQAELPLHFVLLAPVQEPYPMGFPALRMAQLTALALPATAVANAFDLGDPSSPGTSLHPRDKQSVGHRLFLTLWRDVYRHAETVAEGSAHEDVVWPLEGDPLLVALVRYDLSRSSNQGLHLAGTANCTACCEGGRGAFQLRLSDGSVLNTTATVYDGLGIISVSALGPAGATTATALQLDQDDYPEVRSLTAKRSAPWLCSAADTLTAACACSAAVSAWCGTVQDCPPYLSFTNGTQRAPSPIYHRRHAADRSRQQTPTRRRARRGGVDRG